MRTIFLIQYDDVYTIAAVDRWSMICSMFGLLRRMLCAVYIVAWQRGGIVVEQAYLRFLLAGHSSQQ